MDGCLIVSPHHDDAVFSAGQFIHGWPGATIVTVCTSPGPEPALLTTFDQRCMFRSAEQACDLRARENQKAAGILGAAVEDLGFVDHQYREVTDAGPMDIDAVTAALRTVAYYTPNLVRVLGPVGLAHPDHVATAAAVARLAARPDMSEVEFWLYEELPGRVLWPEQTAAMLLRWGDDAFGVPALDFAGTGDLTVKRRACGAYRSQLWAPELSIHNLLVPERMHRLHRKA